MVVIPSLGINPQPPAATHRKIPNSLRDDFATQSPCNESSRHTTLRVSSHTFRGARGLHSNFHPPPHHPGRLRDNKPSSPWRVGRQWFSVDSCRCGRPSRNSRLSAGLSRTDVPTEWNAFSLRTPRHGMFEQLYLGFRRPRFRTSTPRLHRGMVQKIIATKQK